MEHSAAYQHIAEYTESLLPYPKPQNTAEANANKLCPELAEFWRSEEGQDWRAVIQAKVNAETDTSELQVWRSEFDAKYARTIESATPSQV